MSVDTEGTRSYDQANTPTDSTDWSMTMWVRRETDTGSDEGLFGLVGGNEYAKVQQGPPDDIVVISNFTTSGALKTMATGVWNYLYLVYVAESGGGGNATLTIHELEDGESTFGTPAGNINLTDQTYTDMVFGCTAIDGTETIDAIIASIKVYSAAIGTTNALTERSYTENQTGNEFATYEFLSGALTTDSSANNYALSQNGSGGSYVATKPTDLTIGGPVGGTGNGPLVGQGGLAGAGGGLAGGSGILARGMEKVEDLWLPDRKIIVPVGITLQGA